MATSAAVTPHRLSFGDVCMGRAPKRFYLVLWLPLLTVLWAGCFFIAWRAYPNYQFPNHDISFLGHPALNPQGWWYWSLGMGIASVMMFPPVRHLSRQMHEITLGQNQSPRRFVSMGSFCLHLSCVGLMGLALAPQGERFDLVHKASGALAMGGMYATLLILWSAPLFKAVPMSVGRVATLLFSTWWGVIGFLLTQGYRFFAYGELGRVLKHKHESILLRFSLWEWMLFVAGTTAFVVFFAFLPSQDPQKAKAAQKKREEPVRAPLLQ